MFFFPFSLLSLWYTLLISFFKRGMEPALYYSLAILVAYAIIFLSMYWLRHTFPHGSNTARNETIYTLMIIVACCELVCVITIAQWIAKYTHLLV